MLDLPCHEGLLPAKLPPDFSLRTGPTLEEGPVFEEAEAGELVDAVREILSATSTRFSLVLGSPTRTSLYGRPKSERANERQHRQVNIAPHARK